MSKDKESKYYNPDADPELKDHGLDQQKIIRSNGEIETRRERNIRKWQEEAARSEESDRAKVESGEMSSSEYGSRNRTPGRAQMEDVEDEKPFLQKAVDMVPDDVKEAASWVKDNIFTFEEKE